ncbi:SpoIIE family protein phosphatase [Streptomyces brevispora]|uniref:protein-serine/threonine phosphatase n=2 Tax=Streptomyces brevispora TaxID=887462 RepID=A0A561TUF0_9ACTN|nr:SpoIIE family protein phosphatase [Streptomyces brevispora]TWF90737.1 GAF domain-containing protein [Streptomyces brevispora]WSC17711.1 SpoIIE family protein phosphatase [Streptomyces brevispora]
MGGERHEPPPDDIEAELDQIAAMNSMDMPRPAPPDGRVPAADARPGEAARRRDSLLLSAGHTTADSDSLDEALRVVAGLHAPDFPLDGQCVFGIDDGSLSSLGQYGFRPGEGADQGFRIPMTTGYPAVEVARTGRAVFLASTQEYRRRFPETCDMSAGRNRNAWAFLPLVTAGRVVGVWLAAFRSPVAFTTSERALLTVTGRMIAQVLERARAGRAELALSRGLRRSMRTAGPALTGLSVATRYVPTGGGLMVGGDWYDSIDLPNGRLALVIGDVQGHDVHAAGLMTQLCTAVHAYAAEGHGPDAVLARTSRFLTTLDEDRFATCIYIEADPSTGDLHIARAGHPHPVLRMPDGTCLIKHISGGLPLGLMPGEEDYPVDILRLQTGEVLMLCTDGLIENGGHDMYSGWVRVREAFSPGPVDDLEGVADRLMSAVLSPEPGAREGAAARDGDDIALLLLRRDSGRPHAEVNQRRLVLSIGQDQGEGLSEARAELKALLHDWARPDQVDTAVLLATELLGNVLVHTDQDGSLNAYVTGETGRRRLLVEVMDRGDELPHQRTPVELASSGRGLLLLDILADQWGVRPEPEGKTAWFVLTEAPPGETGGAATV